MKSLERIKIEAITAHVSPKSKKNIYYHNLTEKTKGYLNLWVNFYPLKERVFAALGDANRMLDENEERIKRMTLEEDFK